MNDIRRTILWVIFGFSLVLLWDKWQIHNGRKPTFFPTPEVTAPAEGAAAKADASAVPATAPVGASAANVPGSGSSDSAPAAVAREKVTVTTDLYKLSFDGEGGTLVGAELLKYTDQEDKTRPVKLLDESAARYYVAQTGLIGGNLPTHKTVMQLKPGARELAEGQDSLNVVFESPDLGGVKLVKTWTIKRGDYQIGLKQDVVNTGTAPVSPQLYLQLTRDGNKPAGESSFYSTFTGPAVYTDAKKFHKVDFKDIENGKTDSIDKQADNGYVAMVQHYFASAWLLPQGTQRDIYARKAGNNMYSVGEIVQLGAIEPGQTKTLEASLFVGPQVEPKLAAMAPGLELVKDYGWLTILAKPLYWLLSELHKFIGNWGWSIVALVVLLKIAFYWLNAKAYSSMAKMKAINPRIQEMRERLKDKPQQMQQEMMRIYREEKVNPMGGCFPIMIQIPVFMALYWVLQSSVEIRNAPWIGWIHDLSVPDPLFILPIVMTLSSLLQTALNPAPPDPMQAKMMWIMPLMFSVMFFFFPAGLVLYWCTNNILSIAQQWVINKRMGVPPQFNLPKFK